VQLPNQNRTLIDYCQEVAPENFARNDEGAREAGVSPHVIREFRSMGATWDASAKSKRPAAQIVATMKERANA